MSEPGPYVVPRCPHCGAPIRELVNGACPFCATPLLTAGTPVGSVPNRSTGSVLLSDVGRKKIEVIKVLREHLSLGLKEAKDLADAADRTPTVVASGLEPGAARSLVASLLDAGAAASVA